MDMKSSQKVVRHILDSEIFREMKKPSITQSARLHSHIFSITYCYNNPNQNNVLFSEEKVFVTLLIMPETSRPLNQSSIASIMLSTCYLLFFEQKKDHSLMNGPVLLQY